MEYLVNNLVVQNFFDQETSTLTYIVFDNVSKDAVIIDPVLNYDLASSTITDDSLQELDIFIKENSLNPRLLLETHAHADHITGAQTMKKNYPEAKVGIGKEIVAVQKTFKQVFNLSYLKSDGSQFDLLLQDNQVIECGNIQIKVVATPGHTPACVSFLIQDMLFVGDALFMPDSGTGRCDFPQGSAETLYESIQHKVYEMPPSTKIFVGHDYQPNGRELQFETTVNDSRRHNIQLREKTPKSEFTEFREKRDSGLSFPKLLLTSIQININGGNFPPAEDNGVSYLKIPLELK